MVVRRTPLRSLVLTGATLGVLLGVAACTGPGPLARTGDARGDDLMVVVQTPPDEPQGVYYLQHQRVFVHLDPQRDADADTQAFARTFLQRSLAGLQYAVPGNVAGVVPDLALALGRHDPRSTTWTYTLRRGVRFEDGSPVTAREVRYGVSRLFAPSLRSRGLEPVRALLAVPRDYPGPYTANAAQRAAFERAVEVSPDGMTVTFHLRRPAPDFDRIAALPAFGPVPATKDTAIRYDAHPLSTGPYVVSYSNRGPLVLIRNFAWTAASDRLRRAGATHVIVAFGNDGPSVLP
jgi:peptide/nickel transport system substrate-binding protein